MDLLARKHRFLHRLLPRLNFLFMCFFLFQIQFERSGWFHAERHAESWFVFRTAKHFLDGFNWNMASHRSSSSPWPTERAKCLTVLALKRRQFTIWTFSSSELGVVVLVGRAGTLNIIKARIRDVFDQLTDSHPYRLLFVWTMLLLRRDYTCWVSSLMFLSDSLFLHWCFLYEIDC